VRLITEFKGERREYRLHEGITVIGRDPVCDIAFPDGTLSRRHLECSVEGGRILVRDLNTKNGTFLGSQRIEEARLPPGVPLRAGSVWLRFEAEEREELPPAPPGPAGDLESRVPASESYEQDEEPTPAVREPAPAPAPDEARVVVRDNRWYLRDAETGLEVEIVPVQKGGAPAAPETAAPPGAQVPARVIRRDETLPAPSAVVRAPRPGRFSALMGASRHRFRLLLAVLAALIVLIVAAVVLFRPKTIPPLSRAEYRALIDRAVEQFQTDPAAAVAQLRELQQRPAEGEPKLAKILQEAFEADAAAVKNLETGYESAENSWEEVRKSAESTDAAVNLARERYDWFQSQVIDLIYLSAARDAIKGGDYLKALNNAAALNKAGRYGKEAEALTQQATDAIMKTVTDDAAQMHWTDAARHLGELIKARPDLAQSLQPKVTEYEQDETQRQAVEEAQGFVQQGQLAQAGAQLDKVSATGPYAQQAAALREQIRQSEIIKNAQKAFDSGSGQEAVDMLTNAGLGDSETARHMKAVLAAKKRADDAIQAGRFGDAKAAWEEILRLEPAPTNSYRQEAEHNRDNMTAMVKAGARKLVDQADLAYQDHKYQTARNGYEEALKLDPGSKEAKDGLARMSKSALFDFNIAIALPRDTLEQVNDVLEKLQAVRDRILTDDPLYLAVDRELTAVQLLKAKLQPQKPAEQKGP
jgi:hypothetical protein